MKKKTLYGGVFINKTDMSEKANQYRQALIDNNIDDTEEQFEEQQLKQEHPVKKEKKMEIYTLTAGLRDMSLWIRSKWEYIGFIVGFYILYTYVFWGSAVALILGFIIGKIYLKSIIQVDRVLLFECNGESNQIKFFQFGKQAWAECKTEGVMAYQQIEGSPVYFAEEVNLEEQTIKFAWFQNMSHFDFLLHRETFDDLLEITREIVETDILHLTLPQVYGYGEAKKRIKNFVGSWNNVYQDKPNPPRFTKIPDEIQLKQPNTGGSAVE